MRQSRHRRRDESDRWSIRYRTPDPDPYPQLNLSQQLDLYQQQRYERVPCQPPGPESNEGDDQRPELADADMPEAPLEPAERADTPAEQPEPADHTAAPAEQPEPADHTAAPAEPPEPAERTDMPAAPARRKRGALTRVLSRQSGAADQLSG
jgi:hypothetical protein